MTKVHYVTARDERHPYIGAYVELSNCPELPVGPFAATSAARNWLRAEAECLTALYGPQIIEGAA